MKFWPNFRFKASPFIYFGITFFYIIGAIVIFQFYGPLVSFLRPSEFGLQTQLVPFLVIFLIPFLEATLSSTVSWICCMGVKIMSHSYDTCLKMVVLIINLMKKKFFSVSWLHQNPRKWSYNTSGEQLPRVEAWRPLVPMLYTLEWGS